jgi:hypothetical protein
MGLRTNDKVFLHPCVGDADLVSALKEYTAIENILVFAMEKIYRETADEPEELIQCNPRRNVKSRSISTDFRQVFSSLIVSFLDDNGDAQPWVCRVFGILMVVIPAVGDDAQRVDIKLIVACMEEVVGPKTFLPYPVFKHHMDPHEPLKLHSVDIEHVETSAFLVPVLDGDGFAFDHCEVADDFFNIDSLNKRLYYCLTRDRFNFLTHRDETFYTSLASDDKPRNNDKTFVSTNVIKDFEVMYGLDKPRKRIDGEEEDEDDPDELIA